MSRHRESTTELAATLFCVAALIITGAALALVYLYGDTL